MPFITPIYGIEAHLAGEIYSASVDRRRWLITDSQLGFLSDLIGSGVIEGWDVTVSNAPTFEIEVSAGIGIIDRFGIFTYGSYFDTVNDNQTSYLYMKRKQGVIGGFSGFSVIDSIVVVDTTAPLTPTMLSASPSYNQNILTWDENTEADFSSYVLYRSTNNFDFVEIANTEDNSYTDTNLTQNTNYYYRVSALDKSGNDSGVSPSVLGKTLKDLRQPIPISGLLVLSRDSALQILWNDSPSDNAISYQVVAQPLDLQLVPSGSPITKFVDSGKGYLLFSGLSNNVFYKITVFAVSINDVFSEAVSYIKAPLYNNGPSEVEDIEISYAPGDNEDTPVVMTVCFSPSSDPYALQPSRYLIKIFENGGSRETQNIVVPAGEFCRTIRLLPFTNSQGAISYESFALVTNYIVEIKGVDEAGHINNGSVARTSTPTFEKPPGVNTFSVTQRQDFSLLASWINGSSGVFSHNILTVKRTDLRDQSEVTLVNAVNIGTATTYVVPTEDAFDNAFFTFVLRSVDIFGNQSQNVTSIFSIEAVTTDNRPPQPEGQSATAGDKEITIQWTPLDPQEIAFYSIYRGDFTFFPESNSFTKIATVPSSQTKYIDFDVENGKQYMYFVTAINVQGQESETPSEADFVTYTLIYATPTASPTLSLPVNLNVTQSGFDAVLTWDSSAGLFDGYEIWRSVGNKYSFELIASVAASSVTFTDEDALLVAGTPYYYMVRKFRNEADLFITESVSLPSNSTLIAKIVTDNGDISIDTDVRTKLLNMEDPVRESTRKALSTHRHNIDEFGRDKRIDLLSNVKINPFEWTTKDYQVYSTTENISGASSYSAKISGTINTAFFTDSQGNVNQGAITLLQNGIPPFMFVVDDVRGEITFQYPLYSESHEILTPFSDAPSLTLTLIGVSEIQNTLTNDRIGEFSATQVKSGVFDKKQLPPINHDGRIGERLIPVSYEMESQGRFTFTFKDTAKKLISALTFYDIQYVGDEILLAATSGGIAKSIDFGSSWEIVKKTPTAPSKVIYSSIRDKYFVLTNEGVFAATGDLKDWALVKGTENVKVMRDIVEDASGILYVSTDLGVYKLKVQTNSQMSIWEQTTLLGPRSTESYALLYDAVENRVIVSNELGILQSTNQGASWSFTTEFDEFKKIFKFVQSGSYIFALTDREIWRKSTGNFSIIAELDSDISRNLTLFQERLFVSTNNGVFASKITEDVYSDTDIEMVSVFPELVSNGNIRPATSLNVLEDRLFVGTDQKLFIRQGKRTWIQYEDLQNAAPSIFVNQNLQLLGFRYNTSEHNISFDDKQDMSSEVKVAIAYSQYYARYGGWALQKFDSRVILRVNNSEVADSNDISGGIQIDVAQFTGFQFPEYSELNAYTVGADAYKTEAETKIKRLSDILSDEVPTDGQPKPTLDEGETLADLISSIMLSIEKFLSQLFESARVIQVTNDDGTVTTFGIEFPSITVILKDGVSYNATDGLFTFTSAYQKYDKLNIDVLGVTVKNVGELTHKDVEDGLEMINSGLPSSLSQVQHINIVKLGTFNQRTWPNEQKRLSTPYQAKYISPGDSEWYDTLNSSIEWDIVSQNATVNGTLPYVSTAVYLSETGDILAGGPTGAIRINAATIDIEIIAIGDGLPEIKQFYVAAEVIYCVTATDLFSSSDDGTVWTKVDRFGLPNRLFSFSQIHGTLIVGGEDGIYYKSSLTDGWKLALASPEPVEILYDPDLIFAIVNNTVYFTSDGVDWVVSGNKQTSQINSLAKFKSMMFVATEGGLKKDDGTFYGSGANLSLVNIIGTLEASAAITVNDIDSDGTSLVVGLNDGRIVYLNGSAWTSIENIPLKTIHKVLIVPNQIWLFGYDLFVVLSGSAIGTTLDSGTFAIFDWLNMDVDAALLPLTSYPFRSSSGAPL
jgi:fibronectin type 3 domain-containing protein